MLNTKEKDAGSYSMWLEGIIESLKGGSDSAVPCGDCVACCTSSYFVHIKPTDTETLQYVPRDLLFPAPGLPTGHYLLGYDENGHCPMFSEGRCSIYKHRPQTCRQYDCRVFAATELTLTDDDKAQISRQAARWVFNLDSGQDVAEYAAVKEAARFLEKYVNRFPRGFLPSNLTQRAITAISIYKLFLGRSGQFTENEIAEMISVITLKLEGKK